MQTIAVCQLIVKSDSSQSATERFVWTWKHAPHSQVQMQNMLDKRLTPSSVVDLLQVHRQTQRRVLTYISLMNSQSLQEQPVFKRFNKVCKWGQTLQYRR